MSRPTSNALNSAHDTTIIGAALASTPSSTLAPQHAAQQAAPTHVPDAQDAAQPSHEQSHAHSRDHKHSSWLSGREHEQHEQHHWHSSSTAASTASTSGRLNLDRIVYEGKQRIFQDGSQQQQQKQHHRKGDEQARQQQRPAPQRPHPFYLKPAHVKTHYMCPTADGWKLHLYRTQRLNMPAVRHHPVILCPGLGSSGAYSFDMSPGASLADYLASKGWDVWTVELRGNGLSDKPSLFRRSRWWTIDDYVERDVPALIRYVLRVTHARQVHFLGHSMGGMILCGVMARIDTTTAKIRSCIVMGSGLFLEESWWRSFEFAKPLAYVLWTVPSGLALRLYGRLMFGPLAVPWLDELYFHPPNVDPAVGKAMMRRNFSDISPGVILQMMTAFKAKGLLSADGRMEYADPARLGKLQTPTLFMVGDRDRMCPADGCRKTFQLLGSKDKSFKLCGPSTGYADSYGHFDILMGKRVETEVFPSIHEFLEQHDSPISRL